jgi:hypothetical protein
LPDEDRRATYGAQHETDLGAKALAHWQEIKPLLKAPETLTSQPYAFWEEQTGALFANLTSSH